METDGTVYGPVARLKIVPLPEPEIEGIPDGASPSAERADGFAEKQQETLAVRPLASTGLSAMCARSPAAEPGRITGWAALPGEIVVLGVMEDVWPPPPLDSFTLTSPGALPMVKN